MKRKPHPHRHPTCTATEESKALTRALHLAKEVRQDIDDRAAALPLTGNDLGRMEEWRDKLDIIILVLRNKKRAEHNSPPLSLKSITVRTSGKTP